MDIKFLSQNTFINFVTSGRKNYDSGKGTDGRRNKSNARKGCHYQIRSLFGPIFEQHFHCVQERWGRQTSGRFKETEQFDSLSSFENGGFISGKGTTFTKRSDVKKNLKDAYFSRLIHRNSLKNMRFEWEGSLYQFLWLCFGLFQAPLVFTKLLKVPTVFYNI